MTAALIVILAMLVVLLVLIRIFGFRQKETAPSSPSLSHCPACGTKLQPGQRVHTAVYPGQVERVVHVYGCPSCYPRVSVESIKPSEKRRCPLCKDVLKRGEYLVGRMWQGEVKTHVRIQGCSHCRPF